MFADVVFVVCWNAIARKKAVPGNESFGPQLLVTGPDMVQVELAHEEDPFEAALSSIQEVRQGKGGVFGRRSVIQGIVTFDGQSGEFYLADETGGILVRTLESAPLDVGDSLRVSGFPMVQGRQVILQMAMIARLDSVPFEE